MGRHRSATVLGWTRDPSDSKPLGGPGDVRPGSFRFVEDSTAIGRESSRPSGRHAISFRSASVSSPGAGSSTVARGGAARLT